MPAGGGAPSSPGPRRRLADRTGSDCRCDTHRRRRSRRRPPATLRRWVRRGLIPQYEGEWTPAAIGTARVVARMRERGHSLAEIERATGRAGSRSGSSRTFSRPTLRRSRSAMPQRETGLDEGLVVRLVSGLGIRIPSASSRSPRTTCRSLRYVAAVLDVRVPARRSASARAGIRPGDGTDRRRRGASVPPVRARAADAVGRDRHRDRRADARALARRAAARVAGDRPDPPALPAALRRAGRRRPHGGRPGRAARSTSAGCGSRSRSPTWPATRG